MAEVVYQAWQHGASFDAWQDHFHYDVWLEALRSSRARSCVLHPPRAPDRRDLPLGHISTSVRKKFLTEDYLWSLQGKNARGLP